MDIMDPCKIIVEISWSKTVNTFICKETICVKIISLSFRICRLSKIGPDGAVTSSNVMIRMNFFCKVKMGSNREGYVTPQVDTPQARNGAKIA